MFTLPNFFTLLNLFAGCLGLLFILNNEPQAYFIALLISLAADVLDGWSARITNSASLMGKELDSLADLVSFGLNPGLLVYVLVTNGAGHVSIAWAAFSFLLTLSAALRLGFFNIDTRQSVTFIGLPTPSMAIAIAGIYFLLQGFTLYPPWYDYEIALSWLYWIVPFLAYIMHAPLPMISLKMKDPDRREIVSIIVLVAASLALLLMLNTLALAPIIGLYILLSCILWVFKVSANEV